MEALREALGLRPGAERVAAAFAAAGGPVATAAAIEELVTSDRRASELAP